jgi:hypothetical protein
LFIAELRIRLRDFVCHLTIPPISSRPWSS